MSSDTAPDLASLRRLAVDEYHRMAEAGIFDEDAHVELLDGFLVAEPGPSPAHALVVDRLTALLVRGLPEAFRVRVQNPLTFDTSEPQPDLAVVEESETKDDAHPATARLVIEVSSGTLSRDRGLKAEIYARAAIPEYWIVSLPDRRIEVLRDPDPASGRYATREIVEPPGQLRARAIPLAPLDVAAFLPRSS